MVISDRRSTARGITLVRVSEQPPPFVEENRQPGDGMLQKTSHREIAILLAGRGGSEPAQGLDITPRHPMQFMIQDHETNWTAAVALPDLAR